MKIIFCVCVVFDALSQTVYDQKLRKVIFKKHFLCFWEIVILGMKLRSFGEALKIKILNVLYLFAESTKTAMNVI